LKRAKFSEAAKITSWHYTSPVDRRPGSGRPWTAHAVENVSWLATLC